jgi:hypothetical protein
MTTTATTTATTTPSRWTTATTTVVALLVFVLPAAYNCQVILLAPTPCIDWEANAAAFQAAAALWTEPACYNYSYEFLGFSIGEPQPVPVAVRNGVASDGTRTMGFFWDMIESLCIADCPTDGAQYCTIKYSTSKGYPESIYIDMSEYTADEERIYQLSNFTIVNCSSSSSSTGGGSLVDGANTTTTVTTPNTTVTTPNTTTTTTNAATRCSDYEARIAEMQTAVDLWNDPSCYDFFLTAEEPSTPTTTVIQVRNYVAMDNAMSITDYMNLIQQDCLDTCAAEYDDPLEHRCTIEFADGEGYPTKIEINTTDGVQARVSISGLSIVDCGATTATDGTTTMTGYTTTTNNSTPDTTTATGSTPTTPAAATSGAAQGLRYVVTAHFTV